MLDRRVIGHARVDVSGGGTHRVAEAEHQHHRAPLRISSTVLGSRAEGLLGRIQGAVAVSGVRSIVPTMASKNALPSMRLCHRVKR